MQEGFESILKIEAFVRRLSTSIQILEFQIRIPFGEKFKLLQEIRIFELRIQILFVIGAFNAWLK